MKSSRPPISVILFVSAGVWIAATAFVWTSLLTMFLMGPILTVLLINLGFVALIWEALTGALPRAFVALPVLWFGGYEICYQYSKHNLVDVSEQIKAFNEGKQLRFDPQQQHLVIDGGNRSGESLSDADAMVQSYRLPAVFRPRDGQSGGFTSTRLATKPICNRVKDDRKARRGGTFVQAFKEGGKLIESMCIYVQQMEPGRRRVTVTTTGLEPGFDPQFYRIERLRIADDQGNEVFLLSGTGSKLSRIPFPAWGCFPNFSGGGMKCNKTLFERKTPTPLMDASGKPHTAADVIAHALSLEAAPALSRYKEIAEGRY